MSNKYRRYIWVLVFLVVLTGLYNLKHPKNLEIQNLDSTGTTVVAFGDSLVEGVGSTKGHDFVSLLSQDLGVPIVNLGNSGDKTADGLARIEQVLALQPRIVIVLLGGNDYIRKVPYDETFKNLENIIIRIHNAGSAVILVGVRGGILGDSFKGRYSDLAKKYNTAFIPDILDGLIGTKTYMSDLVHPNDAGYRVMADKISPMLRRMLDYRK